MICADWHPDDERLLTRYLDGGGADPSLDAHVGWCRGCAERLSRLTRQLDDVRGAAIDEASVAFGDARLAAQRRAIQQRLGAAVAARVLPFPSARPARHAALSRVAAAVLLVALTGAGAVRVLLTTPDTGASGMTVGAQSLDTAAPIQFVREDAASDAALEAIDLALLHPRAAELRALDALTPHARDGAPLR